MNVPFCDQWKRASISRICTRVGMLADAGRPWHLHELPNQRVPYKLSTAFQRDQRVRLEPNSPCRRGNWLQLLCLDVVKIITHARSAGASDGQPRETIHRGPGFSSRCKPQSQSCLGQVLAPLVTMYPKHQGRLAADRAGLKTSLCRSTVLYIVGRPVSAAPAIFRSYPSLNVLTAAKRGGIYGPFPLCIQLTTRGWSIGASL